MMNDTNDKAIPKIVDFGLCKIIGPNETANEPFGTLGYVAPEVLKKQPYWVKPWVQDHLIKLYSRLRVFL